MASSKDWRSTERNGLDYSVLYNGSKYLTYQDQYVNAGSTIVEGREYELKIVYWSGNGNKITFTINGNTYEAEEQMEWGAWVTSDYNTLGQLRIDSEYRTIYVAGSSGTEEDWMYDNGEPVLDESYIKANGSYEIQMNS